MFEFFYYFYLIFWTVQIINIIVFYLYNIKKKFNNKWILIKNCIIIRKYVEINCIKFICNENFI